MNAHEAAIWIIRTSKIGIRELYRRAGNVKHTVYGGGSPNSDVLARIANACGYDLVLVKRDGTETIVIDPFPDDD